tara:strand:- start:3817 stop:3921 length:105 start_codon:yes stop_codon:yes gene_type:complete
MSSAFDYFGIISLIDLTFKGIVKCGRFVDAEVLD